MFQPKQELFKVSQSTQKMNVWKAWSEGPNVIVSYGELGGNLIESVTQSEAKNIGRANATTAEEQAAKEVLALYKKQVDNKHYRVTADDALAYAEVAHEPRKIKNYKDFARLLPDHTLSSTKLNGSRACIVDGQYLSKIGRPEDVKIPRIAEAIQYLYEAGWKNFDSEIYAHGLSLNRIRSAFLKPVRDDKEIIKKANDAAKKRKAGLKFRRVEDAIEYLGYNPNDDAAKLTLNIFDIPMFDDTPFIKRVEIMHELEEFIKASPYADMFHFLYPVDLYSADERSELRAKVVANGYEGLVHYDPDGVYEFGKRSSNTQKDKPRYDAEGFVYDVESCKKGEAKLCVRMCDKMDNVEIKVMMKGDHQSRLEENQRQYIGQWVTVSYEDLSDNGKPQKPTVEEGATRLCDSTGEPLE